MSECGCKINLISTGPTALYDTQLTFTQARIIYCPLHKAAPELLAALKEAADLLPTAMDNDWHRVLTLVYAAIEKAEKAEGKE